MPRISFPPLFGVWACGGVGDPITRKMARRRQKTFRFDLIFSSPEKDFRG
jgi:hypothetical protein